MEITIEIASQDDAMQIFGLGDQNLKLIRDALPVNLHARNGTVRIVGEKKPVEDAARVVNDLISRLRHGSEVSPEIVDDQLRRLQTLRHGPSSGGKLRVESESIGQLTRSSGQKKYVRSILDNDVVFCVGTAGTGKTYLAVRMAINYLRGGDIRKIILCRPAVEAGEKLGFLPGDFQAKINPYLRPLYDALNEILDFEKVKRYLDRDIIEVIPLAYMRGRTLNNAFIILDEGQNTTPAQLKMFLTRMGMMSKVLVNGDDTQIDLPAGSPSGLRQARQIMQNVDDIGWVELEKRDIVRHPIVRKIVSLYEDAEKRQKSQNEVGDAQSASPTDEG